MLDKTGIYFLLGDNKEVLYIGKTTSVFSRIKQHQANWRGLISDFRFIPCRKCDLNKYEKRWVLKFMPIWNTALKPRKSAYKKKPKANKPFKWKSRDMHFRKLTEKSFIGFGKYKLETVSRLMELGKIDELASMYYKLSHITFFDNILEAIGITPEWRIEKPGTDWAKFYEFRDTVYPEIVERKRRLYDKHVINNAKRSIQWESRINNNKQALKNKNLGIL